MAKLTKSDIKVVTKIIREPVDVSCLIKLIESGRKTKKAHDEPTTNHRTQKPTSINHGAIGRGVGN